MHLVTFAVVTGVCTVLAIFAVIAAPVPPAPGVSGLYIAAAIYVPVALWFGLWGALAGGVSALLVGLYSGVPLLFAIWSMLADYFEGLIPLLGFRLFNVDPEFKFKRRGTANLIVLLLALDVVVAVLAMTTPAIGGLLGQIAVGTFKFNVLYLLTFLVAVGLLVANVVVTGSRAWTFYVIFGVLGASIVSGMVGASVVAMADMSAGTMLLLALVSIVVQAGTIALAILAQRNPKLTPIFYIVTAILIAVCLALALVAAGKSPAYPLVFFGWSFGDVIVLATIGSMLMVILTPFIKRTQVYIKGWIS